MSETRMPVPKVNKEEIEVVPSSPDLQMPDKELVRRIAELEEEIKKLTIHANEQAEIAYMLQRHLNSIFSLYDKSEGGWQYVVSTLLSNVNDAISAVVNDGSFNTKQIQREQAALIYFKEHQPTDMSSHFAELVKFALQKIRDMYKFDSKGFTQTWRTVVFEMEHNHYYTKEKKAEIVEKWADDPTKVEPKFFAQGSEFLTLYTWVVENQDNLVAQELLPKIKKYFPGIENVSFS